MLMMMEGRFCMGILSNFSLSKWGVYVKELETFYPAFCFPRRSISSALVVVAEIFRFLSSRSLLSIPAPSSEKGRDTKVGQELPLPGRHALTATTALP
jgi:hypothetical protein